MAAIFFILGLLIGSFLNVCIYRIPRNEGIIYNTSHCTNCGHRLGALDLIPILSYFFLKGKCRYCETGIKIRYPMVELLTGLIFLLIYFKIGYNIYLIKYLTIFSIIIVITFIDIDIQIIPDKLVILLLLWSVVWQIFQSEISWLQALGGAILGGGPLLLAAVVSKGGMGGGDIKLMFAAGFFLGIPFTALALFISFLAGSIIGITLISLGIKTRKDPIPFGPFLAIGILISVFWGARIIEAYLSFF